jgi:hypothetical protein
LPCAQDDAHSARARSSSSSDEFSGAVASNDRMATQLEGMTLLSGGDPVA